MVFTEKTDAEVKTSGCFFAFTSRVVFGILISVK